MEVEKEENKKAEEAEKGQQDLMGAWGSQVSYRAPVRVWLAMGQLILMMSDWNYEPRKRPVDLGSNPSAPTGFGVYILSDFISYPEYKWQSML